jgi:F0F1-type ATP synthase membrane subunit b/b'
VLFEENKKRLQMVKEKAAAAEKDAEAIKNEAKRQADVLFEENKKRLRSDLADIVKSTCSELASQIESLKQKITAFGANTEQILSESVEQGNSLITMQEENNIMPEATLEASPPFASATTAEVSRKPETKDTPESEEQKTEVSVPSTKAGDADYQGQVALEFTSPVNISKVLGIIMHLNGLSEVSVGEYLPLVDKPLLVVFLREPKNLLQILRALPEVALAEEAISKDETALTEYPYLVCSARRVKIKLSEDSMLDQTKEANIIQLSGVSG